ncbi:MAG: protein translocase subunit SecD [Gloeobacteraceae cyanobacterium ES-bin-144]|nr:protein translocase subunit SecD [Verrucomicrobiales bacterium]
MFLATSLINDPLVVFGIGIAIVILFFWYFATDIERRKRNVGTVLAIGICALCILAVWPPEKNLKGGIDILGGSSFSMHIQPRVNDLGEETPVTPSQVDKAIEVIEKRLNSMGTAEPIIARQGTNGILLQMPGVEPAESDRIRKTLEKVAKLEFREVSPRNAEVGQGGKSLPARVMEGLEIIPGYQAFNHKSKDEDGKEYHSPILLNRRPALGGADISLATPSPQQADAVSITLNNSGTDKMIALTKNMRAGVDRIAVVLDSEVISAPTVNQVPLGKQFIIEGLREPGEVQSLANSLMNPLENALVVDEMRNVSPTLGAAVVKQGLVAGLLALAVTFLFVLIYYRVSGFIAIIGLIVNTIILFGVMGMFGFTFTLPGIAGMILTIGMAVDANVLIYERLREEISAGKSLKNAIEASYDRAFSAIFDSHVTSLITAVILFWLGSGTIKGFAVTLTIGVTASLFSAILVTRVIFRWGIDCNWFKKLSFLDLIRSANYDFMGKRRICIAGAIITLLISLAAFAYRGERSLGIDFTGGTRMVFQLGKETKIPLENVQNVVDALPKSKAAYAQQESNPTTGTMLTVRCATKDAKLIVDTLRKEIPALGEKKPTASEPTKAENDGKKVATDEYVISESEEEVSALIGGSFLTSSIYAIALGLLGIVLYMTFRFEFSFALGGFVAIFHDIIICVGMVVLMGGELSLIHVGAVLTIAGYSISDTIVVFDRVREMLLIRTDSVEKIMNEAINATLSRTLLTSGATLMSVAILAILGGAALRDFGIIIFIGIVVGTFSSIFIASPVVLWWSNRGGKSIRDVVKESVAKEEAMSAAP